MPVVIDQISLTADATANAASSSEEPPARAPMNEDDFRFYYGAVIRSILVEELERATRNRAD